MPEIVHGTLYAYNRQRCKCDLCRAAAAAHRRAYRLAHPERDRATGRLTGTVYREYERLCEEAGVHPRSRKWLQHRDDLARGVRLTREELKAWWLERFSLDEIREMAGALQALTIEEEAA